MISACDKLHTMDKLRLIHYFFSVKRNKIRNCDYLHEYWQREVLNKQNNGVFFRGIALSSYRIIQHKGLSVLVLRKILPEINE